MNILKRNKSDRGVLLLGAIVIVAIIGIMYFRGAIMPSTEARRVREDELAAKLSQMRKALDEAKRNPAFLKDSTLEQLDESTTSQVVREKLIKALRNSSSYTRTYMDTGSVYLRQEFNAPMLEVDVDEKLNVGWRIAVNRVNSSSFEYYGSTDNRRIYKIHEMSNVSEVNQWWFASTTENGVVSIVPQNEKEVGGAPVDSDYPGQKKYGKYVLKMKVK